ncbi:alanine/glycine:cation symporter family protein [Pseudoflavonifractor phocaeensis]|uniref:alanine/glycine:cation symporter family protein n=1 Tax=Pseudoflavonifractor phocaeensis TaxID=1870988 RepID=UPI00313CE3F9
MLERLADLIWQPWLLGLFLLVGLWCSLRTGFFQVFGLGTWLKATVGNLFRAKKKTSAGGLTQFQALSTALASTIGTGSIAGVATAIFFGGPGAVFWMWVSALLGLMTSFVEKTLAVKYRRKAPGGGWEGGPMEYMGRGLRWKGAAKWFSLWCVLASLTGGALVQSNSIASALHAALGWNELAVGLITALATGAVILGGIGRVGKVSETLVPAMAVLFLGSGLLVIWAHRTMVWPALQEIVVCAVTPKAALGGAAGYTVSGALRYGVARGVFTNEAGVGSSAMAHAAADTDAPAEEGFWGMFEVFFATLVVCTVTALTILTSGVYDPAAALSALESGTVTGAMTGSPLSAAAFATVFGPRGPILVAVCLLLFAFTSLLGWSYYGERGLACLTGDNGLRRPFRLIFLATVALGSVGEVGVVWALSDICNGLMALPNLLAVALLAPEAWLELKKFTK